MSLLIRFLCFINRNPIKQFIMHVGGEYISHKFDSDSEMFIVYYKKNGVNMSHYLDFKTIENIKKQKYE